MCLAGLHYCFFREERPSSFQAATQGQNAAETRKTADSALGTRQVGQGDPAIPRVQSNHKIWESIKSLTKCVPQDLMSLILTGRLRSTVIENFKTTLKKESSSPSGLEWQCKVYESCCALLDIGCRPDAVMREIENTLPEDEYNTLHENFLEYEEALNGNGAKDAVATELLRSAFVRYFSICLKGQFLSSHSMLKHIEKLLVHMQRDGIDVSAKSSNAWVSAGAAIRAELVKFSNSSNSSVERKLGTCTTQDLNEIESAKSRLKSLLKRVTKQTSVRPRSNHALGESKRMKNVRLIKAAEETVKNLAESGKDKNQLVKEVAVLNGLISSGLSKAGMQVVVDDYIDQLFDGEHSESYQNLAAVVRLFDENQELPDKEGFVGLLSTRIQEKHKEKLNAQPGKFFVSKMSMHLL
jgi:hypothetical protein